MDLNGPKKSLLDRLSSEIGDQRVIQAIARVPREVFVPDEYRSRAYEDSALPIDEGQTISQPFIVALMVEALDIRRSDTVLEVGAGSGYQAAVLAELARRVVTVERIPSLVDTARERLASLGYGNVEVHQAGRRIGWPQGAPYDGIIVAAAAPKLIRSLMEQLKDGGRLVIPVGSADQQEVLKVTRNGEDYLVQSLVGCRFVPLIGEDAWSAGANTYAFTPRPFTCPTSGRVRIAESR